MIEIDKKINHTNLKLSALECIDIAIEKSPLLQRSLNEIRAQDMSLLSAKLAWMPQLGINAKPAFGNFWQTAITEPVNSGLLIAQENNPTGGSILFDAPYPSFLFSNYQYSSINADLSWFFLDVPRNKIIDERRDALVQYRYLYNVVIRDLIQQILISYSKLQSNILALDKYKDIINASSQAVDALERQYKIQFVSLSDLSNARTQQLNIISEYISLYNSIKSESNTLVGLLGIDDTTLIIPSDSLSSPSDWHLTLDQTIELSKLNNDNYYSLIAQSNSLKAKAESLKLDFLPKLFLALSGSLNYNQGIENANLSPRFRKYYYLNSRTWDASAGIGFSIRFNGGQSIALGKSSIYKSAVAKNSADLSRIQYVTKAKQAYDDLLTSSLRVDASQQAVKEAENVSLVIKTVSAIGITDFTQQVQSIELYANAVLELASAVRDVNIAQINLYRYTSTLPIGMLSLPLLPIKK